MNAIEVLKEYFEVKQRVYHSSDVPQKILCDITAYARYRQGKHWTLFKTLLVLHLFEKGGNSTQLEES